MIIIRFFAQSRLINGHGLQPLMENLTRFVRSEIRGKSIIEVFRWLTLITFMAPHRRPVSQLHFITVNTRVHE